MRLQPAPRAQSPVWLLSVGVLLTPLGLCHSAQLLGFGGRAPTGCASDKNDREAREEPARDERATRTAAWSARRTRDESAGRMANKSNGAARCARARRKRALRKRQERQRGPV